VPSLIDVRWPFFSANGYYYCDYGFKKRVVER
jgi:hypothetical protein